MQNKPREILAIKVRQWLSEWDNVSFDDLNRKRPEPHFYLFTLPASDLRALSGVYSRTTADGLLRSQDLGIQRRHDSKRSDEIAQFIKYGYPWSDLTPAKRGSGQFDDLQKPGWLPTAIVVNILGSDDQRRGNKVDPNDLISLNHLDQSKASVMLPPKFTGSGWKARSLPPIEVIDGQHRLWAFSEEITDGNFELPVVAFYSLGLSWQAYLFWTINIKPKKINASLAFDVYPLLRTENWLEKLEGHPIYRETRSQELVEALWSHPESSWYHRINMLGETGMGSMVTQAAWIKSLMATYVKSWEGKGVSVGGLFGAPTGQNDEVLPWSRAQQAAFLIFVWRELKQAVETCEEPWAQALRGNSQISLFEGYENNNDPAFAGSHDTHLNTNIGSRGVLYVTNDLCYVKVKELDLASWSTDENTGIPDENAISEALSSLLNHQVASFLKKIASILATFDWRTSSAPNLSPDEQLHKAAIRGGAGYKELRKQLLEHLAKEGGSVGNAASRVIAILGY